MNMKDKDTQIRLGAVQLKSPLGKMTENLERASRLVEQAAQQGAQIIALPELAAPGYSMSPLLWNFGETCQGETVHWTSETARRLGVYLGCGFMEADGTEFYNSYVFCQRDGKVEAIVRKTMAETAIFKCAAGPNIINTDLGIIGLGICADNLFAPLVKRMQVQSADLLLMPHAVPVPFKTGRLVSQADIEGIRKRSGGKATQMARLLGIPAVYINSVGPRGPEKWSGIIGSVITAESWRLMGLSTIADSDGTVLAQMDELSEGVIVSTVTLDPRRKVTTTPKIYGIYGGGTFNPHSPVQDVLFYTDAFLGRLSYTLSTDRRRKARAHSSNGWRSNK